MAETFKPLNDESEWKRLAVKQWDFVKLKQIPLDACEDLGSPDSVQPPIFARAGIDWLLFSPKIVMEDNSFSSPLVDGGLSKMASSEISSCCNVKRNPFNEDSCRLSEVRACQPGSTAASSQLRRQVICGSHGEVANNPSLPDNWFTVRAIDSPKSRATNLPVDAYPERSRPQKSYIWSTIAMEAPDQLRQRIAWALLQIFYDILVRNSFTNYGTNILVNPGNQLTLTLRGPSS